MKVYKYGDNVDTDVIIPARYLNAPDEKSLASHCMEDIDAGFASTVEAKPASRSSMQWEARAFSLGSLRYRAGMMTSVSTLSPYL